MSTCSSLERYRSRWREEARWRPRSDALTCSHRPPTVSPGALRCWLQCRLLLVWPRESVHTAASSPLFFLAAVMAPCGGIALGWVWVSGFIALPSSCVLQGRIGSSKTPETDPPQLCLLRRALPPSHCHKHVGISGCGSQSRLCFSLLPVWTAGSSLHAPAVRA